MTNLQALIGSGYEPNYTSQTGAIDSRRLPWVRGEGPNDAEIMFIGEAPAHNEIKQRRPFVGLSGEVLWQLAEHYAGILRSDVYVTNLVKHQVEEDPTPEEIEYWEPALLRELEEQQPRFIVTLGRFSTRFFLGPDATMEESHGLPHVYENSLWLQQPATVIPAYHPAAGLHQSRLLTMTARDLEAVGEIVRGGGPKLAVDQYPKPRYGDSWLPQNRAAVVALDTEGSVEDPWCLTWSDKPGYAGLLRATSKECLSAFGYWLKAVRPLVLLHHSLHDLPVLRAMGIDLVAWGIPFVDTMVMAYDAQDLPKGLKPLAKRLCGMPMRDYDDVITRPRLLELETAAFLELAATTDCRLMSKAKNPKPLKAPLFEYTDFGKLLKRAITLKEEGDRLQRLCQAYELPMPRVDCDNPAHVVYACRDADATLRIYPKLKAILKQRELIEVTKLDNGILPQLAEMARVGMPLDQEALAIVRSDLQTELADLQELIDTLTGIPGFNPRSGDQVADWCRAQWFATGLCNLDRMTPSGEREKTDEAELKKIRDHHPAIELFLEHRGLDKLSTDYADKLVQFGDRYHMNWRAASVFSGRLAEWILTMPAKSERGRRIRSCFKAPPGWIMWSADLGQVELRILASESGDPELCKVFWEGLDPHTSTASNIFGVPYDKVDKLTQRYPSKTTNYLVVYGGNEYTLFDDLVSNGIKQIGSTTLSLDVCKRLIDDWFQLYNGVHAYMEARKDEARRFGYVRAPGGRLRYLPAIHLQASDNLQRWESKKLERLAAEAGREAGNHPIQGGTSQIVKRAQIRLSRKLVDLAKLGVEVVPLLQMHDELMGLCRPEDEEVVKTAVLGCMTADSDRYAVPIVSDWTSAADWGALKG